MSDVKWYGAEVKMLVERATKKLLNQIVFQGEGHTKVNIRENGQIDTGFMVNSVYAVSAERDSYAESRGGAQACNPKATMSQEIRPGHNEAILAVGAEYAIYQEARQSFLWKAVEQLQAEFPQIARTVKL